MKEKNIIDGKKYISEIKYPKGYLKNTISPYPRNCKYGELLYPAKSIKKNPSVFKRITGFAACGVVVTLATVLSGFYIDTSIAVSSIRSPDEVAKIMRTIDADTSYAKYNERMARFPMPSKGNIAVRFEGNLDPERKKDLEKVIENVNEALYIMGRENKAVLQYNHKSSFLDSLLNYRGVIDVSFQDIPGTSQGKAGFFPLRPFSFIGTDNVMMSFAKVKLDNSLKDGGVQYDGFNEFQWVASHEIAGHNFFGLDDTTRNVNTTMTGDGTNSLIYLTPKLFPNDIKLAYAKLGIETKNFTREDFENRLAEYSKKFYTEEIMPKIIKEQQKDAYDFLQERSLQKENAPINKTYDITVRDDKMSVSFYEDGRCVVKDKKGITYENEYRTIDGTLMFNYKNPDDYDMLGFISSFEGRVFFSGKGDIYHDIGCTRINPGVSTVKAVGPVKS